MAERSHDNQVIETFKTFAREYDDLAEDLEAGAIEVRHSELMPQRR